jgi:hypothetical protein
MIDCWIQAVVHWLDHWQTLVAGMLALFGAAWTVRVINNQIKQATEQEKQRLRREEQAAKAVLPLALVELAQYAEECIRLIAPYVPANEKSPEFPENFAVPRIPEGTIEPLRECARYASTEVATQIRVMVSKLQIQNSRLDFARQHGRQGVFGTLNYYEGLGAIIDAAELHALIGILLQYAREDGLDPPMSFQLRLHSPLVMSGLIDHPKLKAEIARRFPDAHRL